MGKNQKQSSKVFLIVIVVLFCLFVLAILAYFLLPDKYGFSSDSNDWSNFGGYLGGIGSIFSVFSVLFLIWTYRQDKNEKKVEEEKDKFFQCLNLLNEAKNKLHIKYFKYGLDGKNEASKRAEIVAFKNGCIIKYVPYDLNGQDVIFQYLNIHEEMYKEIEYAIENKVTVSGDYSYLRLYVYDAPVLTKSIKPYINMIEIMYLFITNLKYLDKVEYQKILLTQLSFYEKGALQLFSYWIRKKNVEIDDFISDVMIRFFVDENEYTINNHIYTFIKEHCEQ